MSAWAIYSMLGFYPDCPGSTSYALTTPVFDKVTIHLDSKYYKEPKLVIHKSAAGAERGDYFTQIQVANKLYSNKYRLTHAELTQAGELRYLTQSKQR